MNMYMRTHTTSYIVIVWLCQGRSISAIRTYLSFIALTLLLKGCPALFPPLQKNNVGNCDSKTIITAFIYIRKHSKPFYLDLFRRYERIALASYLCHRKRGIMCTTLWSFSPVPKPSSKWPSEHSSATALTLLYA